MRHPSEIMLFLEAKTKEELVKKQWENNLKHQCSFVYSYPMKDGDKWVMWFTANVSEMKNRGDDPFSKKEVSKPDEDNRRSRKAKI